MKKFLVIYRSPISAREQMSQASPEQAKAGMEAWMSWKAKNEGMIVDFGMPLGDAKLLQGGSASDGDGTIAGYGIMQAESEDALVEKLQDHPHFMMPGGASIEVHAFMPMPGM